MARLNPPTHQTPITDSSNKVTYSWFSWFSKLIKTAIIGEGTSTTATAGAQTLPANPEGFIVVEIQGTRRKIPYYNV